MPNVAPLAGIQHGGEVCEMQEHGADIPGEAMSVVQDAGQFRFMAILEDI